jgi:OOP family OmpA-OmpF porin
MNYSTLKKTVALSFFASLGIGMANAQTAPMASGTGSPKLFGGAGQYNTWSVGFNVGATNPALLTGGVNDYTNWKLGFGYGLSLKDQVSHAVGIQWDLNGGKVAGSNKDAAGGVRDGLQAFSTQYFSSAISGVVDIASINYLHRKNSIIFYVKGGVGLDFYDPLLTRANGSQSNFKNPGQTGVSHTIKYQTVIPVGGGVKFKLSDVTALNLGYTENFVDADNFDGLNRNYPTKDKYGYSYAGLDFTLGSKSKPSLEWTNPIATMYDELYDEALRKEVAALKTRVGNVESAVNDLKKDSDGDGVSDQFDKCPNTPAGTVVDGSGCEIHFPKLDTTGLMRKPMMSSMAAPYSNIQFDFDSSVLRTSSYPVLDATSAELRSGSGSLELDGFASSEGTAAHNLRLSKDRANAVKTYLVNSGVDAKRIKVKGFGETKPIADNSTEEGRIANRRVEFKK